jgi:hypothetical protein
MIFNYNYQIFFPYKNSNQDGSLIISINSTENLCIGINLFAKQIILILKMICKGYRNLSKNEKKGR